ncbi:nad dependent epimerase dehydratase [Ophiostoma piceae UAMH 11346]|uniref:Nad dependent epimerase dehydratase n=1 Tax=Ophiostoma piceae (strain UAMH 11346) TaxID=1262450 RepID=S3BSL3_OPHP1|nr:nad dependent epimerase dehydratase [Ophiostoma piceae UAMH 11346]
MSHHVLLLGGHGKIAQLLTPLLLHRNWTVTSVIRSQEQVPAIQALAPDESAKKRLHVLVHSLEDLVQSSAAASALLDQVRADYVVWSAGAGGKGGPERTLAIDRDAASHLAQAAAAPQSPVTRFVLVSYLGSRRTQPSWWDAEQWAAAQHVNSKILPTYYEAKLAADEVLYKAVKTTAKKDFVGIDLRPGSLTDSQEGTVELGKTTNSRGAVSRATVARITDLLLAHANPKSAWIDLLDGSEDAQAAVDRVVAEGVDAVEGEPVVKE